MWKVSLLLLMSIGCGSGHPTVAALKNASRSNTFTLQVAEAYDSKLFSPQSPTDTIPELAFIPTSGKNYKVEILERAEGVIVVDLSTEKTLSGVLSPTADGAILTFELDEGTFAGGRFVVTDNEASLTIYGSGLPIVSSEKGTLTRRN